MNTINEDDKFYWICDADDCYFVREHGVGQHIAKCTTKERAEQITKALSEIERLRKENEELNVVNENIGKQSGDKLIVIMQLKDELAALKKQVEDWDRDKATWIQLVEEKGGQINNFKKQVEDLANFIMNNIPQEPSKNEGAIECAIRIIQTQKKKLDWIHVNDKLPEPGQRVIIEGGMGFHQNGSWYTIVDEGNKNPLPVQWQVLYWKYLPSLT